MAERRDYRHLWEHFALQRLVKKDGRNGMVVTILWWGLDTGEPLPGECFEVAWEVDGTFDMANKERIYGKELVQILAGGYGSMPPPHQDCPVVEHLLKPLHKAGWKVSRDDYQSLLSKAQEAIRVMQDAAAAEAARVAANLRASRPNKRPVKRQPKQQQPKQQKGAAQGKGQTGTAAAAAAAGKGKPKQQKAKEAGGSKSKGASKLAAATKQADKQQGQQAKKKEPKLAVKKTTATKAKAKPQGKAAAAGRSPVKK